MEIKEAVRKSLIWISGVVVGAVGLGPLIAEMIKRWTDRSGYLDDPSKGSN